MGKRLIVIVLSVVMAVIPCCVSVSADDSEYSEWRTSEELHEERLRLMDVMMVGPMFLILMKMEILQDMK